MRYFFLFLHSVLFTIKSYSQNYWNEVSSSVVYPYSGSAINATTYFPPTNKLYAAIGNSVYIWDGTHWIPLGIGSAGLNANAGILTLTTDPSGNVYAGGWFSNQSGRYYIAKWNGSNWSELGGSTGSLSTNGPIYTMASDPAGNIYASGNFTNASGKIYIAKWNGTNWSETGSGSFNPNESVHTICSDVSGNIYVGGFFTNTSGKRFVAKWNGSFWSEVGTGATALNANFIINSIATDASGNVYAAGGFVNAANKQYVAKWNGNSWSEVGTGTAALNANAEIKSILVDASGNIFAAGSFSNSPIGPYIAKWNGSTWSQVGTLAVNSTIYTLAKDVAGNIYASGNFTNGNGYKYVARWSTVSNSWAEINSGGTGVLNVPDGFQVYALATDANNNLYAGGNYFTPAGTRTVSRWNGSVWSELGSASEGTSLNTNGAIRTIITDPVGNVYAAGEFYTGLNNRYYVAKWNGTTWAELGTGTNALNANGYILTLAFDGNGNLYAAGNFTNSSGINYVAKWNGTTWSTVGTPFTNKSIPVIKIDAAGNIYAPAHRDAGFIYFVSKWNGTAWSEVMNTNSTFRSSAPIHALALDASGNLYARGSNNIGGNFVDYVNKWDGNIWAPFAGVTDNIADGFYYTSDHTGAIYYTGHNVEPKRNILAKSIGNAISIFGPFLPLDLQNTVAIDLNGKIYVGGAFRRNGRNTGVTTYDAAYLPAPQLLNINTRCTNSPTTAGKLGNPPVNGLVTITQDGLHLTYNSIDSSFIYYTNGATTIGQHSVLVRYSNTQNIIEKDTAYSVVANVNPQVTISGTTTVFTGQSTMISSSELNGGASPTYQWQDSTASHTWQNISGAKSSSINYTPAQTGVKLRCQLTSNASCIFNSTAFSNVLTFTVTPVTAINAVPAAEYNIRYYPNPVHKVLYIDSLRIAHKWETVEVFAIGGSVNLPSKVITGRVGVTINVESLPAGQYVALLRRKTGPPTFLKFIKL